MFAVCYTAMVSGCNALALVGGSWWSIGRCENVVLTWGQLCKIMCSNFVQAVVAAETVHTALQSCNEDSSKILGEGHRLIFC